MSYPIGKAQLQFHTSRKYNKILRWFKALHDYYARCHCEQSNEPINMPRLTEYVRSLFKPGRKKKDLYTTEIFHNEKYTIDR